MTSLPWTAAQNEYLRRSAGKVAVEIMATELDRSVPAVRRQAVRLGLWVGMRKLVRWTPAQDAALGTRWTGRNAADLAKALRRTPSAIVNRVRILGLGLRPLPSGRDLVGDLEPGS